jgi:hypothetical protein
LVVDIARPVWINVRRSRVTSRSITRAGGHSGEARMDDTVGSMRVAVAFVMLVAACGSDPHLNVVVVRPADVRYQAEITKTVVSITSPRTPTW